MPMQRYKPEQIVTVLRQVEVAVASGAVARINLGASQAVFPTARS